MWATIQHSSSPATSCFALLKACNVRLNLRLRSRSFWVYFGVSLILIFWVLNSEIKFSIKFNGMWNSTFLNISPALLLWLLSCSTCTTWEKFGQRNWFLVLDLTTKASVLLASSVRTELVHVAFLQDWAIWMFERQITTRQNMTD